MKTEQTGSRKQPGPFDDTLGLIITCVDCGTQRSFKVNDSFGVTIIRQSSGMEILTWCEKCGQKIKVQLAWTKRHRSWTVEEIFYEDTVTVIDEYGLKEKKGAKVI